MILRSQTSEIRVDKQTNIQTNKQTNKQTDNAIVDMMQFYIILRVVPIFCIQTHTHYLDNCPPTHPHLPISNHHKQAKEAGAGPVTAPAPSMEEVLVMWTKCRRLESVMWAFVVSGSFTYYMFICDRFEQKQPCGWV